MIVTLFPLTNYKRRKKTFDGIYSKTRVAGRMESMRRIRRNSKTLLQDLFYRGVHGGDRDTPVSHSMGMFLIHGWHCIWTFSFSEYFLNRSQLSLEMLKWSIPLPVWLEQKASFSSLRIQTLWRSTRSEKSWTAC